MAIPVDHFSMERRTFPKLYLCIVCNLYSYSDIAHEKSLWIHGISHDIPRTKSWGLAMVYPTESSLPIGKQQMINTGNCSTQWTHCCDLTLKLRHIAKQIGEPGQKEWPTFALRYIRTKFKDWHRLIICLVTGNFTTPEAQADPIQCQLPLEETLARLDCNRIYWLLAVFPFALIDCWDYFDFCFPTRNGNVLSLEFPNCFWLERAYSSVGI